MQKKILIPVVSGVTALALVGGVAAATAFRTYDVTLTVDGQPQAIEAKAGTVAEVLEAQGLKIGAHDVVLPSPDTKVTDGLSVAVNYARPFEVSVDGKTRKVWTTARSVEEALGYLNLDEKDSLVSTSRSAAIGREGLSVDVVTAKDVKLISDGKETPVRLAGTVEDVLTNAGIKPDSDDIVKPALATALADGMTIQFTDVEVKASAKDVKVPFEKTTKKSDKLPKGEEKVTTKGVDGLKRETFRDVYHDGKKVSSKKHSEKVLKNAVAEVTTVGTKEAAAPSAARKGDNKSGSKGDNKSGGKSTGGNSNNGGGENLTPAVGNQCKASYYWDPQPTASGERFNTHDFTAAHKSLPFGTRVKVTNKANGRSTVVRINDRGPYIAGRCLDLSTAAMKAIGGVKSGVVTVTWQVVG
ncbi:septal ring lytic transglycosylase RlpA family protein [uncultured Tessaracoccus sp.]|uniref:septal ring lytic transglycosylase RlpA family protein n=1 Tax=uncultured Tessaracoccus sp. TaxID=905023 RepID=UPI002632554F|nr:septal ring lytic transglycosylase RlpA family protein [uncultured Tessaracoccus sp.]